jgi:hypothetical protein
MTSFTQRIIGRMTAILFFGGGLAVLLLPTPGHAHLAGQIATGVTAEVIGALAWFAPWQRWPRKITLVLVPLALGLLGCGVLLGNYNQSTNALYYMLVFVWIGISHKRGTALAFAPMVAAAYVLPLIATGRTTDGVTSVWEVVVLSVLVGEGLSWMSTRLRRAEALDSSRVWEMQMLLQAAEGLARERDPAHALS